MNETSKGLFYAILTATMWGVLAIILKYSLANLSPVDVTWFRFLLAFVLLAGYYLLKEPRALKIITAPPVLLIPAAMALGLNYLGFISGINFTTPGIAQVFIQTGPFLLALSGIFIYKEKVTYRQMVGFALVICGILLFYNQQLYALQGNVEIYKKGISWTVFGGVTWAVYASLQKKLVRSFHPMKLNLVLFGLPALIYTPFVDFQQVGMATPFEWFILVILGLNTLIAYGSLAIALKYLEAHRVSVIITMNPILTFVIMGILTALEVSWMVHEQFTLLTIAGAVLVLSGTVLANLRKKH
ncbi:MAG: EamA family transporter [Bacteroidetes bacterium]|jgi:drug/metabolite transporter (DMT)-like permease|nr:EamA family transporter [Bacteroidota bacterium]